MIELPTSFVTNMMASASSFLDNFSPLIYTIVGVLLGVTIIKMIISAISSHK
jgi:hypothetical protein